MESDVGSNRNGGALFFAWLFVGTPAVMLWLGRWKIALAYLLAIACAILAPIGLAKLGVMRPMSPFGIEGYELIELLAFAVGIIGLIHAYRLNAQPVQRPTYARWPIALLLPFALWLGVGLVVRTFFYHPFSIPSASSVPNYLVGDYVFVSKSAYKSGGEPQAGDTAVFKYPGDLSVTYIKRVVGMPGDKIQMTGGVLNINGTPVKMEEVKLPPVPVGDDFPPYEGIRKFYRETLPNGRSYVIADMGKTSLDDTDVYEVPAGHYFVMGDSRDNSQDSRLLDKVGYVPRENFIGPVVSLFWNGHGLPIAGRPEEIYPPK